MWAMLGLWFHARQGWIHTHSSTRDAELTFHSLCLSACSNHMDDVEVIFEDKVEMILELWRNNNDNWEVKRVEDRREAALLTVPHTSPGLSWKNNSWDVDAKSTCLHQDPTSVDLSLQKHHSWRCMPWNKNQLRLWLMSLCISPGLKPVSKFDEGHYKAHHQQVMSLTNVADALMTCYLQLVTVIACEHRLWSSDLASLLECKQDQKHSWLHSWPNFHGNNVQRGKNSECGVKESGVKATLMLEGRCWSFRQTNAGSTP